MAEQTRASEDKAPVADTAPVADSLAPKEEEKPEVPAASQETTASPEQVEINLADTSETLGSEKTEEPVSEDATSETAVETPVVSKQVGDSVASSTEVSLAASGKGKRGASHPMALPATVNDTFVDVALTAKADDARPALTVSGKTAAMARVASRASAPTTLPKSAETAVEPETAAE